MLNEVFKISDYFQYLISSKGRHGINSPFIYGLNENVIHGKNHSPFFDIIETTRRKMIKSRANIDFIDLGSGGKSGQRSLSEIVTRTSRNAKYLKLLYRLVDAVKPAYSLELGTGTGMSTMYQSAALKPEFPLHTIEGSNSLIEIAKYNAEQCGLASHIDFHPGNFDDTLQDVLNQLPRLDYVYIDGNHSKEPTLKYFDAILTRTHENSVVVFDDINWSADMKEAWSIIKNYEIVTVTVDLFELGIVFFKTDQEKEHFKIRF